MNVVTEVINDEHTAAFIECFHGFDCLWNILLKSYHKKEVKRAALRLRSNALRMDANHHHEKEITGELQMWRHTAYGVNLPLIDLTFFIAFSKLFSMYICPDVILHQSCRILSI